MKGVDTRPRFEKKAKKAISSRLAKIEALRSLKTPEARAERKRMNDRNYGRASVNLDGFFHPNGKSPVRCK